MLTYLLLLLFIQRELYMHITLQFMTDSKYIALLSFQIYSKLWSFTFPIVVRVCLFAALFFISFIIIFGFASVDVGLCSLHEAYVT